MLFLAKRVRLFVMEVEVFSFLIKQMRENGKVKEINVKFDTKNTQFNLKLIFIYLEIYFQKEIIFI